MPRKGISKRMEDFIAANTDLISDYDAAEGTWPFDICKYDAIEKIQQLLKIDKSYDFKTALTHALQLSIKYGQPLNESLDTIIKSSIQDSSGADVNVTQLYFNDIGKIYKQHKGNYNLEYCEENRDALIALNTKMVVSVAKKFQGLGVPLNDLIGAGNEGLCIAWEKFDPKKSKVKEEVLEAVKDLPEHITYEELNQCLGKYISYGNLKLKFDDYFHPHHTYKKEELLKWIDRNIYNAKFSSVCMMWILALIKSELDSNSRLVKKPKAEIYKDKALHGAYQKETVFNLDAPIANDTDTTFADTLSMEDETETDLNITEAYDHFKENMNKLLDGVPNRDRTVILLRYGIGVPRSLTPKEIADKLDLSVARISQISVLVMQKMRENATKYGIDPATLFDACTKFR